MSLTIRSSALVACCLVALSSPDQSERCPKLSWPLDEGACSEASCDSDDDCGGNSICCSNGCVKTCHSSSDGVLAFDWSEEPSEHEIKLKEKNDLDLLEEGTVSLPGGCILNMEQYIRFEDFKNNEYIEDCFCKLGNILCHVSHR